VHNVIVIGGNLPFRYRAIDLYEVIIPSERVFIGKQRNPKYILDDVEELCKK